jgi:hypothetical protein
MAPREGRNRLTNLEQRDATDMDTLIKLALGLFIAALVIFLLRTACILLPIAETGRFCEREHLFSVFTFTKICIEFFDRRFDT